MYGIICKYILSFLHHCVCVILVLFDAVTVYIVCSGDMLEHLVQHPSYKLATIRAIPHVSERAADYSTYQWPGLLRHLRQMLVASAPMEEGWCRCYKTLLGS